MNQTYTFELEIANLFFFKTQQDTNRELPFFMDVYRNIKLLKKQ